MRSSDTRSLLGYVGYVGDAARVHLATHAKHRSHIGATLANRPVKRREWRSWALAMAEDVGRRIGNVGEGALVQQGDHNVAVQLADARAAAPLLRRALDAALLPRAQQQVAVLPLDIIPLPAPLAPGSRMPLRASPLFVGREDALRAVAAALKGGELAPSVVPTAAVTGIGGVGKTQVASEFVHRYGQFFLGGVFWLSFAEAAAVPVQVAACGDADGMALHSDFRTLPLDEQVRLVRAAWQSALPRLLVLDNCEDAELLDRWRPTTGGCRLLITSRRAEWEASLSVQPVPLHPFARGESVALLRKHLPDAAADDPDLGAVAAELGDLPLALQVAGKYLARYRHVVPLTTYLTQLRGPGLLAHRSLSGGGPSLTGHEPHVARTFALSYERLRPDDPIDALALTLLARAAHFAPGAPLPRSLLVAATGLEKGDVPAAQRAQDALARLAELGLLTAEGAVTVRLHRLLGAFVLTVATDRFAQDGVERAVLEAAHATQSTTAARSLLLEPHLRAVTDSALDRGDERAAALSDALGTFLRSGGDYTDARRYLERALVIREQVLGSDDSVTASTMGNLGAVLRDQGDYAGARRLMEQALAIRVRQGGEEDAQTAVLLNNLGMLLRDQRDYVGARRYLEQALAIREQVLGQGDPLTANTLTNLGALLRTQGEYVGARRYLERALAIYEHNLGPDHPHTATALTSLGMLHRAQGDDVGAQRALERALAIREQVLGPDHPETGHSLSSLGDLLAHHGRYTEALAYLERATAIYQSRFGNDHPRTQAAHAQATAVRLAGQSQPGSGWSRRAWDAIRQVMAAKR